MQVSLLPPHICPSLVPDSPAACSCLAFQRWGMSSMTLLIARMQVLACFTCALACSASTPLHAPS